MKAYDENKELFITLIRQPLPGIDLLAITLKPIYIETCMPMTTYVYT